MRTSLILSFILFLGSCAIQVPPGGGDKDVEAPELLSAEPENFSTGFSGNTITLNFNEYVSLQEIGKQLIISPLLKYTPDIKVIKKSIVITFQDTLLQNTTYTLNFGSGIVDNNEGNKLENFQYVFSTGNIIDSLNISGNIKSAFDNKTTKDVLAMLYTEDDDSIPYLKRPLYFARTNDSGVFMINNISPAAYKIIGLREENGDYTYLQGEEQIAFLDSPVFAGSSGINLRLFKEIPSIRFLKGYSESPGKAVLVFNTSADTIRWKWLNDTSTAMIHAITYSPKKDSIFINYRNVNQDSLGLVFDHENLSDTVLIRLFKKPVDNDGRIRFLFIITEAPEQSAVQNLHLPHYLLSNHPVDSADFSRISLMEDSIPIKPKFSFNDSLKTKIKIEHAWKSKAGYVLFIPPGTFKDIFGLPNDSVNISFASKSETDYGSVRINFDGDDHSAYVIQLTDESGNVFREAYTNADNSFDFPNLDPKVYKIKLIADRNGNRKWDTGNLLNHVHAEEVEFYRESVTVRANWDVELQVKTTLR